MEFPSILADIATGWLGSVPIVVGLVLTVAQLRHVQEAQKISNQLEITKQHREIWSRLFENPELGRILKQHVNLEQKPVTAHENLMVTFLILHLKASFRAKEASMLVPALALREDIRSFFSLPIPKEVWNRSRRFQDEDFLKFVEESLFQ
jgi:hypothetical protein